MLGALYCTRPAEAEDLRSGRTECPRLGPGGERETAVASTGCYPWEPILDSVVDSTLNLVVETCSWVPIPNPPLFYLQNNVEIPGHHAQSQAASTSSSPPGPSGEGPQSITNLASPQRAHWGKDFPLVI